MALSDDHQATRRARLEGLKQKLRSREGKKEFTENCEALRQQIANLEKVIAEVEAGGLDL